MLSAGRTKIYKGRQVRKGPELPPRYRNRRYEVPWRTGCCRPDPGRKLELGLVGDRRPAGHTAVCAQAWTASKE